MPFLIIFVLIPLSEIMIFVSVSDKIGLVTALLIALFTAILGGFIVKYQGMHTIMKAKKSMDKGALPAKELFDGMCLIAAGATLITPGFITDALGFALLIPAIRDLLRQKLSKNIKFQDINFNSPNDSNIIDVEYETIDDDKL